MATNPVDLVELDSIEIKVIVDNEVDPISQPQNPLAVATGGLREIAFNSSHAPANRGGAVKELRMDEICCGAHGLSLMIVGGKITIGKNKHAHTAHRAFACCRMQRCALLLLRDAVGLVRLSVGG
jgi:hypothetical protein